MEAEMKSACMKAGAKLGIGLSLLLTVIGIRIVTTTPVGASSGLNASELSNPVNSNALEEQAGPDDSLVGQFRAGLREAMPDSDPRSRDDDPLVSCRLAGRIHFMRAGDCALRGGQATEVSSASSSD